MMAQNEKTIPLNGKTMPLNEKMIPLLPLISI